MNNSPVAIIAAHPDDEVLGCGGTIARLAAEGRPVHILLLADGESSRPSSASASGHHIAARHAAAQEAGRILGCASVQTLAFPDNRMDHADLLDIIRPIENFLAGIRPGLVMTHHAGDVNIDHRIVHDAVIAACRPQPGHFVRELLFFEVPSSTEWRPPGSAQDFAPNWFVNIDPFLQIKLQALEAYRSELRDFPHPRSLTAVEALARWRGACAGFAAAEAFILGRKIQP